MTEWDDTPSDVNPPAEVRHQHCALRQMIDRFNDAKVKP